jgi:putative phosphoesterase
VEKSARLALRGDGSMRIAVVADTHSAPHPGTTKHLSSMSPDAILHAGDVGDLAVLDELRDIAPLLAVRGNIDGRVPELPDVLIIEVTAAETVLLRVLLLHIAVDGPRLRADAARLARARGASLVVCGHSHVPLVARDGDLAIFNPGSAGPRRFALPIVFGAIDVSRAAVRLAHFECATGAPWLPGPVPAPAPAR